MEEMKPYCVKVENVQVPTMDFVFEQMMAQNRRLDRAKALAVLAVVLSVLSFAGVVAAIVLTL